MQENYDRIATGFFVKPYVAYESKTCFSLRFHSFSNGRLDRLFVRYPLDQSPKSWAVCLVLNRSKDYHQHWMSRSANNSELAIRYFILRANSIKQCLLIIGLFLARILEPSKLV